MTLFKRLCIIFVVIKYCILVQEYQQLCYVE